jgi:hypothetical protein
MKYLWIGLVVTALASLEFLHEFGSNEAPGGLVCTAQDERPAAMRELLLQHLKSH